LLDFAGWWQSLALSEAGVGNISVLNLLKHLTVSLVAPVIVPYLHLSFFELMLASHDL